MKNKSCKKMPLGGLLNTINPLISPVMGFAGALINDYKNVKDYNPYENSQSFSYNFNNTNNIPLMPMGGIIPYNNETVELERGEPFMYPNGNMDMISNNAPTHSQGGVPISLPNGTKVLGKNKIMNNKSFKEEGAKLKRQGDKYRKILENKPTRIAERTSNLMLEKINREFNNLFNIQENNKSFEYTNKMPDGGTIIPGKNAAQTVLNNYRPESIKNQNPNDFEKADYGDLLSSTPLYDPNDTKRIVATENYYKGVPGPHYILPGDTEGARMESYEVNGVKRFAGSEIPNEEFGEGGKIYIKPSKRGTFTSAAKKRGKGVQSFASQVLANKENYSSAMVKKANFARNAAKWRKGPNGLEAINPYVTGGFNPMTEFQYNQPNIYSTDNQSSDNSTFLEKYAKILNFGTRATSLAPVAYNLFQGLQNPELISSDAFSNPYANKAMSLMQNRRYNINPELEANKLSESTYYRNLREGAPSQAQFLGNLQTSQINTQRANAAAFAKKQNIDNQYLAEQAQFMNNIGNINSERQRYIENINAQTKANRRNMIGTGLSQLSEYKQKSQLMNNQMVRDLQRMNLLPSLVQNFNLNEDGSWSFKDNNTKVDPEYIWNFVTGNIR